jgi:hypothetical protein
MGIGIEVDATGISIPASCISVKIFANSLSKLV